MFLPLFRKAAALSPLLLLLFWASQAWAFPVTVEMVGTVPVGQNPKLVLMAVEDTQKAEIRLKRDDGQVFTFALGNMQRDQTKEITLDGRKGRHHYQGEMVAEVAGEKMSSPLEFTTFVSPPIELSINRHELDLNKRQLVFSSSAVVSHVQLTIFGPDNTPIHDQSYELGPSPAKQPITLRWLGTRAEDIVRLELRVTDEDGFFKAVALTPWSVSIPHEEVLFESNSSEIKLSEQSKLEDSLKELNRVLDRFQQIKGVQLFIAGHTDTRGKPAHNAHLSRLRAQSIGNWFITSGVRIPVYFEGFGESSLKVKTNDEVDEPQNRRVDYILAVETPPLRSQAHSWKRLK